MVVIGLSSFCPRLRGLNAVCSMSQFNESSFEKKIGIIENL